MCSVFGLFQLTYERQPPKNMTDVSIHVLNKATFNKPLTTTCRPGYKHPPFTTQGSWSYVAGSSRRKHRDDFVFCSMSPSTHRLVSTCKEGASSGVTDAWPPADRTVLVKPRADLPKLTNELEFLHRWREASAIQKKTLGVHCIHSKINTRVMLEEHQQKNRCTDISSSWLMDITQLYSDRKNLH